MESTKTEPAPGSAASLVAGEVLEIPHFVDASTGDVEFAGDVLVRRGIRERMTVKSGGSLEVRGIIEGAILDCGGNLTAHGGLAGHERGQFRVAGNVQAKFLNNFGGSVRGHIVVEREIINADLAIGGAVRCPAGTIIGGRLIVTGAVEVSVLGSAAGAPTHLVLGTVPFLDGTLVQVIQVVAQLTAARTALSAEQEKLARARIRPTAGDRERQTEILFEAQDLDRKLARATYIQETCRAQIAQRRTVQVAIAHHLFKGVVMTVGGTGFQIVEDRRGPLSIGWQKGVGPVCQREGGALVPLTQIARTVASADTVALPALSGSIACAS